ncbi:hypothetical protein O9992_20140 [Vibrio lentus]|nr:hypothetical protein [Vibrio lentus]
MEDYRVVLFSKIQSEQSHHLQLVGTISMFSLSYWGSLTFHQPTSQITLLIGLKPHGEE